MLLERDISPENNIYYLGGVIINFLNDNESKKVAFFDLFEEVKNKYDISLKLFIFTIDWLYLAEIIAIDSKGTLKKCF